MLTWEEKLVRLAERLGVEPLSPDYEDRGIVLVMPDGSRFSAVDLLLALLDRMDGP